MKFLILIALAVVGQSWCTPAPPPTGEGWVVIDGCKSTCEWAQVYATQTAAMAAIEMKVGHTEPGSCHVAKPRGKAAQFCPKTPPP